MNALRGLEEGAIFADRYRVVRCIAAGGMGAVYEVIHTETERRRALKVMHPYIVERDELRARFKQEARVAASVESEHIVDVSDAGFDEKTSMPFLVMELLRGEELGRCLERVKRFAPDDVLLYLHQTSLALDKTHKARIVHRDLKPENLFLCERDEGPPRIKILDFGIAKIIADGATKANATRSIGTPLYMAPEQFRPGSAISPGTDIFALGMIAYTLLVGAPYWQQEQSMSGSIYAFLLEAVEGPKEPATMRAAKAGVFLPPAFDSWFAMATARSPADRFPTASAAVQALADALGRPRPGYGASGTTAPGVRLSMSSA
ncbi:MAG TPA: serine/threonine-protein kinase, partial [Polyangium sp.]|nr:serine/threonine-protein kinase [Polyangium sp.]